MPAAGEIGRDLAFMPIQRSTNQPGGASGPPIEGTGRGPTGGASATVAG